LSGVAFFFKGEKNMRKKGRKMSKRERYRCMSVSGSNGRCRKEIPV